MRRVPGVLNVGTTSFAPMSGSVARYDVDLPGTPAAERPRRVFQNIVSANLLDVMGIRLAQGRTFTDADTDGAPRVAVINETAARLWWPNQNPVGRRFVLPEREGLELTVVGVMADMQFWGRDRRARAEAFLPAAQDNSGFITFIVHASHDPSAIAPQLKRAVWSVAPSLHVGTDDLQAIVMDTVRTPRFYAWALSLFAVAAVLLSGLGIHGLLAFAVSQRKRELGIRVALGATPSRVGWSVVRRALVLGSTGVVIGIAAARGLTRFLESQLLEVTTTDPTVFVLAALSVTAIAVLAGCAPAYQALRVDPVRSLRE
jgi:putative ABC transport system permease protein